MPSSTAQEQVFAVPLLLESILLYLPLGDLLINAPRISAPIHAFIETSTPIQQALFLAPLRCRNSNSNSNSTACPEPTFNPLLQARFPAWFSSGTHSRNAAFQDLLPWRGNEAAYQRKEASWRRMLPVQPPPTTLAIEKHGHYQRGDCLDAGERVFRDGVPFGVLYDRAYETVRKPIGSFEVEWEHVPRPPPGDAPERNNNGTSVKIVCHYTFQCRMGMPLDVGDEFRSDGYEESDIDLANQPPTTR